MEIFDGVNLVVFVIPVVFILVASAYLFGKGRPFKKIKEGHYLALGGHRRYSYSKGESFFFLLMKVGDDKGIPIYLDTKNYYLDNLMNPKGVIINKRVVIKGNTIKLASALEISDYTLGII